MRILLANQPRPVFGGSETYLLTIGCELERLGHEVEHYAPAAGEAARLARERGARVLAEPGELPRDPQLVLAQDGESCAEMAARYPDAVRVYVSHATWYLPQLPPQVAGAYHAIVTMNDATERLAQALAEPREVVRLRQPVDLERFTGRGEPAAGLKRVLLLGNHWSPGTRNYRLVADACGRLGLELVHVGRLGRVTTAPELEIADADAVLGVGRCILEGMASKRAAYVFGDNGVDGWVTPDTYGPIEAHGFAGGATEKVVDLDRLCDDLGRYDADMGHQNRNLATARHSARRHVAELINLVERLEPGPVADPGALETVARLVRVQADMTYRLGLAEGNNSWLRTENQRLMTENDGLRRQVAGRRYRLAVALGRPIDRLRRSIAGRRARD